MNHQYISSPGNSSDTKSNVGYTPLETLRNKGRRNKQIDACEMRALPRRALSILDANPLYRWRALDYNPPSAVQRSQQLDISDSRDHYSTDNQVTKEILVRLMDSHKPTALLASQSSDTGRTVCKAQQPQLGNPTSYVSSDCDSPSITQNEPLTTPSPW
nr:hypothetical protein Iba_chr06bCG9870 [Ipomoea batatas]